VTVLLGLCTTSVLGRAVRRPFPQTGAWVLWKLRARGPRTTLDLPLAPPNSPTPLYVDNDILTDNPLSRPTLPSVTHFSTNPTPPNLPFPTLIPHHAEAAVTKLPNSTLVPTHGCEDPLPVPVDTGDRLTLHDMCTKNGQNIAGKNNATTHDNDEIDDTSKLHYITLHFLTWPK